MVISEAAEKAFDIIQYPFMVKTLHKRGIEGNFLNLIKGSNQNLIMSIILNGRLNVFS